eukprot:8302630-Karenia_brevis.AAC.1
MIGTRYYPRGVNQLAEGGAVAEEQKGYLRIRELAQSRKQLPSLAHPFFCVVVAEGSVANRAPEKFKAL